MNPLEHNAAYKFSIGSVVWVGEVTISGGDLKPHWDVKEAKGSDGASSTLISPSKIRKFKVRFHVVNDPMFPEIDQFSEWDSYQKIIESTVSGSAPKALPVYHPDLARVKITAACHDGIGVMQHDGKGGATVDVDFIEHRPAKPKPAKKATAASSAKKSGPGKPAKVDPNAQRKQEVAALLEQAKAL